MRTPLHSQGLVALLLAAFCLGGHQADAQTVQIDTGTPHAPLYAVGPIYMSTTLFYRYSRYAYLYTQPELEAAGIMPGSQISAVGWMKSTSSTAAGPAVFTIYMKNSEETAYDQSSATWADLSAGASAVYTDPAQSIPATADPDYIDFALPSPFEYTGGSLEVLTEWNISAASAPIATGAFEWVNTVVEDRIYGMGGTSLPTTLSSTNNNTGINDLRPVVQFTVDITTGVGEELGTAVRIWPNPAEQDLHIRNESKVPFESIVITDITGKVVQMEKPSGVQADQRINVAGLQAGPYTIGKQTAAGRVVKRFMVL
jgi:hypothetical protein